MCGIFGFSAPGLTQFQRGILAVMLAKGNDERGGHSWGVLGHTAAGAVETHRGLGDLTPEASVMGPYTSMFAHTRYATQGAKTVANAHPFQIGRVTGAHNGIVYNHEELSLVYDRDFEVDSMHLVAHLDAGLPMSDIEGYGALVWVQSDKPTRIFLSRMLQGDLSVRGVGTPDNVTGVVWSSDEDHLKDALAAAGILEDTFEYRVNEGSVLYASVEGKLYVDETRTCELSDNPLAPAGGLTWESYRLNGEVDAQEKGWGQWEKDVPPDVWEQMMGRTVGNKR